MTPKQLIQFLAICRHGSLSSAAAELNIAQPALSKQLSNLEHELGAKLFTRHTRGVALTRSGERLREEASDVIGRIEALKQSIRHANDEVSGNVTLAVITSLAPAIAVELYPRIERDFPRITLKIVDYPSDRAGAALLNHEVDLAIMPNAAVDLSEAKSTPLFQEAFHLISRASIQASTRPVSLAEAVARPLALPFSGHDLRRRIDEAARSNDLQPNVKYQTSSINVIGRLVEEGLANSIAPTTFWLSQITSGRIMARQVVSPTISRVHSICWLPALAMSRAAEIVRDAVAIEVGIMLSSGKLSSVASV